MKNKIKILLNKKKKLNLFLKNLKFNNNNKKFNQYKITIKINFKKKVKKKEEKKEKIILKINQLLNYLEEHN